MSAAVRAAATLDSLVEAVLPAEASWRQPGVVDRMGRTRASVDAAAMVRALGPIMASCSRVVWWRAAGPAQPRRRLWAIGRMLRRLWRESRAGWGVAYRVIGRAVRGGVPLRR